MFSCVDESNGTNVDGNELSDCKVEEIEREVSQPSIELRMRYRLLEKALKYAG